MKPSSACEKKGGRKKASVAQPGLLPAVEAAIAKDTAGSPVDENIRWTNRSPADLTRQLNRQGFRIGVDTLRRILFDVLGLSRRQAFKEEAGCHFPQRDEQFRQIAKLRDEYQRRGWPTISIDTKKKEILGDFFHAGRALTDGRVRVQDHDFVSGNQRLVPYGVYDVQRNEGLMLLARGADTCELACDAIWRWWQRLGRRCYGYAPRLLLLCDCGGSNGYRQWRFKQELCELAADLELDVQVAHYPPGCSKYNPIEHRMFCHVSRAWRAVVLKTIEVARTFAARTRTAEGLRVLAEIARHSYTKGLEVGRHFIDHSPIRPGDFLPQLNYTAPWAASWRNREIRIQREITSLNRGA
jgi:hypothetical protein